ncbi:MAG: Fe-S cluster assembly protein SufD [Armatimonadetes bacterium]|nr:Fe-S cluster assembly protein SufD [Armatimonadota bacterium]
MAKADSPDTLGALRPEMLLSLSQQRGEPSWLAAQRESAGSLSAGLDLPSPLEEAWRRTDPQLFRWDGYRAATPPASRVDALEALPGRVRDALTLEAGTAGVVVNRNGGVLLSTLDETLRARGVVFCDLATAARDHGELLRKYRFQATLGAGENVFLAMNAALATGGLFLYLPRNVVVESPLCALDYVDHDGAAVFTHVVLVAEPGSAATVIQKCASPSGVRAYVNSAAEISVGDAASLRHVLEQDWSDTTREIGTTRARVGRDATYRSLVAAFGGETVKQFLECLLEAPGGAAEMLGVLFADGTQHVDYHTLQAHQAPHTASDLLYKVALEDQARSIFAGMIRVAPGAQKTNAFQSNRNMLLNRDARADSKPELEILANDLRCTHGSALSRIEEQHLFYLMARGLTRAQATHMIVEGFFAEALDRVPMENVRGLIEQRIAEKMGAEAPLGRVTALRALLDEVGGKRP